MSEHHTQGRQGQGARHHRRYRSNRNYRHRMPRPDDAGSKKKPSLLKRVLAFFGFGKKKAKPERKKERPAKGNTPQPPQRVRVAQPKGAGREGASAQPKSRRRPASVPPTEQARLYVGNLSFEATEAEVEDLFKGFGRVRSVEIIYNTRTYRSKGYAFVEMEQLGDAQRAAEVLHGQPFMGRELMVSAASERMERSEKTAPAEPQAPAESAPQSPVTAPKASEDEIEADFGEEIVVPLNRSAQASELVAEKAEAPAEQQAQA